MGTSGSSSVCFPDWYAPATSTYWSQALSSFDQLVPVDGIWVDSTTTAPSDPTDWRSIPSSAITAQTTFDNARNLYEDQAAAASYLALNTISPGERTVVVARTTFSGVGQFAGQRIGANSATWEDLRSSVMAVLNMNMLGVPFSGPDICGYHGDTTEELCLRWMQVGAFYPLARNHNQAGRLPQEPYRWPGVEVAARQALRTRYLLLPYFYLHFFYAHTTGRVVARPLFFAFPDALPPNGNIWDIVEQFMIGDALLVSPVLHQGATDVRTYFPEDEFWYDFYSGEVVKRGVGWVNLPASLDSVNLHIREASIVPTQEPALTTRNSRLDPFPWLLAWIFGTSPRAPSSLMMGSPPPVWKPVITC